MQSLGRDLASEIEFGYTFANTSITAGGGGDNTAINGASINLATRRNRADCAVLGVMAAATLASSQTLVVTAKWQTSANGSDWTDLVGSETILTLTATGNGAAKLGVDLTKADQYVRPVVTPNLSASGTDTATIAGTVVFGGLNELGRPTA